MLKSLALRLVVIVGILFSQFVNVSPVYAEKPGVCGTPGKDGPVTTLSGVINSYYPGTANVTAGATSIPVGAARTGGGPAITAGDLLLVVQVQGADINSTNTNNYGDGIGNGGTAVNTIPYSATLPDYAGGHLTTNFVAGTYEYVVAVGPVSGGAVPISSGLYFSYFNADFGTQGQRRFQVIRVPQYSNATLGGTVTSLPWNGTTGGFVVLDVAGQLNWNGNTINVDGQGFRGGAGRRLVGVGNATTLTWWDFRTLATLATNGSKGEGYAGTPRYVNNGGSVLDTAVEGYPNGSYGRGAAGNGGGGSTDGNPPVNDQNSGGGGGANGGYGGMGGDAWNSGLVDGGYGGSPFPGTAPRLVMGGGGGAGTTNNGTPPVGGSGIASSGAAGGGVVFVRSGTIIGTGAVSASGANAATTVLQDGGGGGGAGGSILVVARNGGGAIGNLTVNARGGNGGSDWLTQNGAPNRHGPGGGGGGGFAFTSAAVNAASSVAGGINGVTTAQNTAYGATPGGPGVLVVNVTSGDIPPTITGTNCLPLTPAVTKITSTPVITQTPTGVSGVYTITASVLPGSPWAAGVVISDTLPSGAPGTITYASTNSVVLSGLGTTRTSTSDPAPGTTTPSWGTFLIPPGGSVAITFTVNFSPTVPAGIYQNPAVAAYLDPLRTTTDGSLAVNYDWASSTQEDIEVLVAQNPALSVVKTVTSTGPYSLGSTITYSIVATNTGNITLTGVTITDPGVGAVLGTCAPIIPATLAPLASVTCSASHVVTQADINTGSYTNTAIGDSDQTPPGPDTEIVPIAQVPLIGLAKQAASVTLVSAGTYDVTYNLLVKNYGNVALFNLEVTDDLSLTFPAPATFTVQSLTSASFTVNPAYNGSTDISLLTGSDPLPLNGSGTIVLVVRVVPDTLGPYNNSAAAAAIDQNQNRTTDISQDGVNPDSDSDGNPTDNNDPTPVSFIPRLFDPPIGIKVFDDQNLPVLQWTVTWINNSNAVALNVAASDPIPAGTIYRAVGAGSGYPMPPTAPAGSTTIGITCTDASTLTTTAYCYYEGPTPSYPRGRTIWVGVLGPDLGATDAATAKNEINITFRVIVDSGVNSVSNVATIDADRNGDGDITDPGEQRVATASAAWRAQRPERLPSTGFAPDRMTVIPAQPAELSYRALESLWMEIPSLGIKTNITGIPNPGGTWNVTWLGREAGWLQGTAFPTTPGNSAITGHVYMPDGKPGPFVNLYTLKWGDQVIVHFGGDRYVYEVRAVQKVKPDNTSALKHEERSWVTLITCQGYNESDNTYAYRTVVRAVLIKVTSE